MAKSWSERWLIAFLVSYTVGITMWLVVSGVRVTVEDGFYYLKIAQHVAQGAGSTFDGLNPTNGYHPLWLLTLVPLFWLTSSVTTALTLSLVWQVALFTATMLLVYYTSRLHLGGLAAGLAALLWVLFTYRVALGGLEFSLHALGVLTVAYLYLRWFTSAEIQPYRRYFVGGLVSSLTILARLDTILLMVIMGIVLAWREARRGLSRAGVYRLLIFSLPLVIVCVSYIGLNLSLFGHPTPVSSEVKRAWSTYLLKQDLFYQQYGWVGAKLYHLLWPVRHIRQLFLFMLVVGTAGAGFMWLIAICGVWRSKFSEWRLYSPFILFSLLTYLSYGLLYHGHLSFPPWYYVVQPWLAALLLATLVDQRRVHERSLRHEKLERQSLTLAGQSLTLTLRAKMGEVILSSMMFAVVLYTVWELEQWRIADQVGIIPQPLYEGAAWVKTNLPDEAIIGAWNAGAIGYLSERRVVNLDGLVNSWVYHETDSINLCHYWQAQGITYLVDIFDRRTGHIEAVAPQATYPHYAACADQLELIWSDQPDPNAWWHLAAYRVHFD